MVVMEDDAIRTPSHGNPPLTELVSELTQHDGDWDIIILNQPPPYRLEDIIDDPSHGEGISEEEYQRKPTRVTEHLMRVGPVHKAVGWVCRGPF